MKNDFIFRFTRRITECTDSQFIFNGIRFLSFGWMKQFYSLNIGINCVIVSYKITFEVLKFMRLMSPIEFFRFIYKRSNTFNSYFLLTHSHYVFSSCSQKVSLPFFLFILNGLQFWNPFLVIQMRWNIQINSLLRPASQQL